jgi:tetratricopeptide (TPR) repeat protein
MALQRMDAAEVVIIKALELDPDNINLTLQLANVYYSSQRNEEVFPLADKVIAGATEDQLLNDGYIVAIKAGLGLGSEELLEKYVTGLEESFPLEYLPGLIRHLVAVRLENVEAADAAADTVTARFPGNPDVIRSLLSTWLSVQDIESGFRYLNRSIEVNQGEEALASLYFYRALLGAEVAETKEALVTALEDVAVAEGFFKKVYPEDHEVFGMIVEIRAQWESALASFEEMTAEDPDATSAASDEDW